MSKTILLVDDEEAVLRALQRTLQRAGYRVLQATSADRALELLSEQQVALVVSDYRMPGLSGAELLSQVRQLYPTVLGLILSAYADREALLACLNSGAAWRFLEKPWDDQQLLMVLSEALKERDARLAEQQRTNVLLSSQEALLELSVTGQVLRFNHAACQALQLQPSELRGKVLSELFSDIHPVELASFLHRKDHDIQLTGARGGSYALGHRISDLHHYMLMVTPLKQVSDAVLSDLAELLSREQLIVRIEDLLSSQQQFAVGCLQLHDFELYAESLSQAQLDELLSRVAQCLHQRLPARCVLATTAADKFVVLLPSYRSESQLQLQLEQLLQPFRQPLQLTFNRVLLSFAVGYVLAPADGHSARLLLQHTDAAVRQNFSNPSGFYLRFDAAMAEQKRRHFAISTALHTAVEEQQFQLWFQPKIRLEDGVCDSAEALLRWQHPELGAVSPAIFIPIAEQDGQIYAIGDWVLQQALQYLQQWQHAGLSLRQLAVNLSGRQLTDEKLAQRLQLQLQKLQLAAGLLELEVTETFLLNDIDASSRLLADLRQLGCHLAMDDFGTGYSSLAYLAKLPIDKLKLDRSLLLELEDSPQCASMIRHMIRMAHELGLQVVAEGIESDGQVQLLRAMQCDYIQGYVFSKPLSAPEFVQFLQQQPVQRLWQEAMDA